MNMNMSTKTYFKSYCDSYHKPVDLHTRGNIASVLAKARSYENIYL